MAYQGHLVQRPEDHVGEPVDKPRREPPGVRDRLKQGAGRDEGALVVSAGTSNTDVFARAIRELRDSVLAPLPRR